MLGNAMGTITVDMSQILADAPKAQAALDNVGKGGAGLDEYGNKVDGASKRTQALGGSLMGIGGAVLGGLGVGIKIATDFEAQMKAVKSVSGATGEEYQKLREEAMRLGAASTFSATESAAAMEIMLKAGASVEDVMGGATESVINLATATGTDLTLAAETASAVVNVFGISYKDAADTIAQASNASAIDVNDFALAMKSAGPAAKAAGYSFQDMAGSLIILGDAGIKGEVAGTALRNIIQNLSDSSSEGSTALAEYGISTRDAAGNMKSLDQITSELIPTWNTLTGEQKNNLAIAIAGKDGAAAWLTMMDAQNASMKNGSTAWADANDRMERTGTAAQQAKERMDSLKGAWEEFTGALEVIAIKVGSAFIPALRMLVDFATAVARAFASLPEPILGLVGIIAAVAAVIAVAVGAVMVFLPMLGTMGAAFGIVTGAAGIFIAIAAVVAAAVLAWKTNFLGVRDALQPVADALGNIGKLLDEAGGALDTFLFYFNKFRGQGQNPLLAALNALTPALGRLIRLVPGLAKPLKAIQGAFQSLARGVKNVGDTFSVLRLFMNPVAAAFETVSMALKALGEKFPAISGPANALAGIFHTLSGVAQAMGGVWSNLISSMNPVAAAFTWVGVLLKELSAAFPALSSVLDPLSAAWTAMGAAVQSLGDAFGDLMKGDITGFFSNLGEAATHAWDAIKAGVQALGAVASALWDAFVGAVQSIDWGAVGSALLSGLQSALSWLAGIGSAIWGWLSAAVSGIDWAGLWDGVQNVTGIIIDRLGELGGRLIDWVMRGASAISWGVIANTAYNIAGDVIYKLGELGGRLIEWVVRGASAIDWGAVVNTARNIAGEVVSKLGDLGAALKTWVGKAFADLNLGELGATLAAKLREINLVDVGRGLGENLVSALGSALANVSWGSVGFAIGKGIQVVLGAAGALVAVAVGIVEGIATGLSHADWGAVGSALTEAFKGIWRGVTDGLDTSGIERKLDSVKKFFNDLRGGAEKIGAALKTVGDIVYAITHPVETIVSAMKNVKSAIDDGKSAMDIFKGAVDGAKGAFQAIADGVMAIVHGLEKAWDLYQKLTGQGGGEGKKNFFEKSLDDAAKEYEKQRREYEATKGNASEDGKYPTNNPDPNDNKHPEKETPVPTSTPAPLANRTVVTTFVAKDLLSATAGQVRAAITGIPPEKLSQLMQRGGEGVTLTAAGIKTALTAIPPEKLTAIRQAGGEAVAATTTTVRSALDAIPANKSTALKAIGGSEVAAQTQGIKTDIEGIPDKKSTSISLLDSLVAIAAAQAMKKSIDAVPSEKTTTLSQIGAEVVQKSAGSTQAAIGAIQQAWNTAITETGGGVVRSSADGVRQFVSRIPTAWATRISESGGAAVRSSANGADNAIRNIPTSHFTSISQSGAGSVASAAYEAAAAVNGIPSFKSVTVQIVVSGLAAAQNALAAVGAHASGGRVSTPITWLAERGRELVQYPNGDWFMASMKALYSVPLGSYVYNNRETEAMLRGPELEPVGKYAMGASLGQALALASANRWNPASLAGNQVIPATAGGSGGNVTTVYQDNRTITNEVYETENAEATANAVLRKMTQDYFTTNAFAQV